MNSNSLLILILVLVLPVFMLVNMNQVFAITENFSVSANEQKTFDVVLDRNQKIFFQIFVKGGENDDIRLKIIDSDTNSMIFNGIIRQDKQDTEYDSTIFEAYKSEISNHDDVPKNLTFIFDNSLSTISDKNVDFIYNVLIDSSTYFEQTEFWSWIYSLVIIITMIVIVMAVIVTVIKKIRS